MTEQLLARGDRVAGTVRKIEAMDDLKARYGELLWLANLDVTDTPAVRHVVDEAFNQLGKIDVVVSNAGYGLIGAAEEVTDEQVIHRINTNLIGSIQLVRAALPHLRRQGGGRIIQLSTMGGQAAFPGGSMYHASKWGIEGFIDAVGVALAHTWASVGVGSWLGNAAGIRMRGSGRCNSRFAPDHWIGRAPMPSGPGRVKATASFLHQEVLNQPPLVRQHDIHFISLRRTPWLSWVVQRRSLS